MHLENLIFVARSRNSNPSNLPLVNIVISVSGKSGTENSNTSNLPLVHTVISDHGRKYTQISRRASCDVLRVERVRVSYSPLVARVHSMRVCLFSQRKLERRLVMEMTDSVLHARFTISAYV